MFVRSTEKETRVVADRIRRQDQNPLAPVNTKSEIQRAWTLLIDSYISRSHIHGLYLLFLPSMRRRMRWDKQVIIKLGKNNISLIEFCGHWPWSAPAPFCSTLAICWVTGTTTSSFRPSLPTPMPQSITSPFQWSSSATRTDWTGLGCQRSSPYTILLRPKMNSLIASSPPTMVSVFTNSTHSIRC